MKVFYSSAKPQIPEVLEQRVLFAAIDVEIGGAGARSVHFLDGDGTAVSVLVRGGTAIVRLTGEGLTEARTGQDVTITGSSIAVTSVAATGTSRRTALLFTASGGDEQVRIGQISTDGSVRRIGGRNVVLTGGLATGGAANRLELLRAENATITIGAGSGTLSLATLEGAANTSLSSAIPINRLAAGSWTSVDGANVLSAPSVGRAIFTRAFSGQINVGSAGTLDLGMVDGATVRASGSLRRLQGATALGLRVEVGGDIAAVSFDYLGRSRIYAGVRQLPAEFPVPMSSADFVADSSIGRFNFTYPDSSNDVVVAASSVGNLRLLFVAATQTPDIFFVADRIRGGTSFSYTVSGKPRTRVRIPPLDQGVQSLGSVEVRAL